MAHAEDEQRLEQNDDPQEVVGPEECSIQVAGTTVSVEEILSDETDTSYPAGTEISEQFVAQPVPVGIDPTDGMARPLDDIVQLPIAPPFNHRSLVCMEDDRVFVELFEHEAPMFADRNVSRLVWDVRRTFDDEGKRNERRQFRPDQVNGERWDVKTVEEDMGDGGGVRVVFVRPIRPACQHYKRSVLCHDPSIPFGEIGHEIMYRNCAERRSVGGAFMSLNSEAVYACELRSPREPQSEKRHLVDPDKRRLTQVVENVSLFNLEAK